MKKYDLIIVSCEPFPSGKAASNRILSYAIPIASSGKKVLLLTFSGPSYGELINADTRGNFSGVDFFWTGATYYKNRPCLPIRAALYLIRKVYFVLLLIFHLKAKVYVQVNSSSRLTVFIYLVSRLNKARFIREISETPENISNIIRRTVRKRVTSLADGIIPISPGIQSYFSKIRDKSRFFLLPIIVDLDRFNINKVESKAPYFFYCSGGVLQRDGFLDSIKAFLLFHTIHPEYKLRCAFPYNSLDCYHSQVMRIIMANTECVEYLGSLPTSKIPELLINASALLVTPANNYKTKGFPTKLGEYFASSTPVICTSIDDLDCLKNQNCAFLASPGNIESISEKMCYIAEHKLESEEIGRNGRCFVENNYTMKRYLESLLNFLFNGC